jgi:hypothetical protein
VKKSKVIKHMKELTHTVMILVRRKRKANLNL